MWNDTSNAKEQLIPFLVQAPAPLRSPACRACRDGNSPAKLYEALGRRLLQSSGPPCCTPQSQASFCGTSKCTIFLAAGVLGMTLAALAVCGLLLVIRSRMNRRLWEQRAAQLQESSQSADRGVEQLQAVKVGPPPQEGFAGPAKCPICWENIADSSAWRLFACGHGTCRQCHDRLVQPPGKHSNCPLCRLPLVEPVNTVSVRVDARPSQAPEGSPLLLSQLPLDAAESVNPLTTASRRQTASQPTLRPVLATLRGGEPAAGEEPPPQRQGYASESAEDAWLAQIPGIGLGGIERQQMTGEEPTVVRRFDAPGRD